MEDQAADRPRMTYHHGNLREALIEVAVDLLDERGVDRFSLTEAARRVGVAVAAPYRHFEDREDLLGAVGRKVGTLLAEDLRLGLDLPPDDRLPDLVNRYIAFAGAAPPRFAVMCRYAMGGDSNALDAVRSVFDTAGAASDREQGRRRGTLGRAAHAVAHGYATMLLGGGFGSGGAARASAGASDAVALLLRRCHDADVNGRAAPTR